MKKSSPLIKCCFEIKYPSFPRKHLTITSGKIINKNWGLKSAIHFSSHFVYAFIDIATELLITSKIIPVISLANWTHLNFKSYFSQAYSLSKCVGGLRRTLNGTYQILITDQKCFQMPKNSIYNPHIQCCLILGKILNTLRELSTDYVYNFGRNSELISRTSPV